jgi:hypothetical protein
MLLCELPALAAVCYVAFAIVFRQLNNRALPVVVSTGFSSTSPVAFGWPLVAVCGSISADNATGALIRQWNFRTLALSVDVAFTIALLASTYWQLRSCAVTSRRLQYRLWTLLSLQAVVATVITANSFSRSFYGYLAARSGDIGYVAGYLGLEHVHWLIATGQLLGESCLVIALLRCAARLPAIAKWAGPRASCLRIRP